MLATQKGGTNMLRGFCTLVILLSCSAIASAAQVTYSWTGTVSPIEGSTDPWNVGPAGQAYSVSITVDLAAADSNSSVGPANFGVLALEFAIAGVAVPNVDFSASSLEFADGYFGGTDFIGVTFVAELNGHTETFGTSVIVPDDTFSFLLGEESPPVFGPVNTSLVSGHFLMQYLSNTASGVPVTSTVVPEPATWALAAVAFAALVSARRRRPAPLAESRLSGI
jgi:MYXO-CTERM domain-containing protein